MANNTGTFFNINDNDGIPLVGVSTDGKVMINHLYGNCLIGSTSVTGTASQPLQVTGGAYVSGNLGIGTTNPTSKLLVNGTIGINASNDNSTAGRTQLSSSGSGFVVNHNDNSPIIFQTLGVDRFRWDHNASALLINTTSATGTASQPLQVTGGAYVSGNLGVGITNPSYKLHIVGGNVYAQNGTIQSYNSVIGASSNWAVFGSNAGSTPILINRNADPNGSKDLFIDTSGNVLIGSTSSTGTASQPLQVSGGAYLNGFVGIGATTYTYSSGEKLEVKNGYAAFINPSTTVAPIYAYNTDTTASTNQPYITLADNAGNRGGIGVNYTDTALWIHGQSGIRFRGGGGSPGTTEWARFDSSGNLGIGQASPSGRIHITSPGITASAPSLGWPNYNAESDAVSKAIYVDTAGNGSVGTASSGATVSLILGSYYDSRAVITPIGAGGGSPSDQGTGNGKDLLIKGGTSDNNIKTGGRLFLSGGSGYSGGFNTNYGVVSIQPFGGSVGIGTTNPTSKLEVNGIVKDSIGNIRSIPQNLQTSAYTLASTDVGKHVAITTGGITIPSSVFSIGDNVTVFNNSNYNQMITPGIGVTLRRTGVGDTGARGLNGYGLATILCIASNNFVITGAGLT
jgi:hypothetical protein